MTVSGERYGLDAQTGDLDLNALPSLPPLWGVAISLPACPFAWVVSMCVAIQRLLLAQLRQTKASLRLLSAQGTVSCYSTRQLQCWKCDRKIEVASDHAMLLNCPCEQQVLLPPTCNNYFAIMQWYGHVGTGKTFLVYKYWVVIGQFSAYSLIHVLITSKEIGTFLEKVYFRNRKEKKYH